MCFKPPVYRQLAELGTKEKALTAQRVMSGTQCSHRFLTTNTSISLPTLFSFTLLAQMAGTTDWRPPCNIPLKHTVYSVKKEIHVTGFISIVCLKKSSAKQCIVRKSSCVISHRLISKLN